MTGRAVVLAALLAVLALLPGTATAAPRLVLALSDSTVTIRSNFTGTNVVLFGTIEGTDAAPAPGGYDLIVSVTGPTHDVVARRKARMGGVWLNADSRTFVDVPDYFALLANRPFGTIADHATMEALGLTPASQLRPGAAAREAPEMAAFRTALLHLKTSERLWAIRPDGVAFVTPALFRATIPVPADVPVGSFGIRAVLFRAGEVVARAEDNLVITKSGFEERVVQWAEDNALLYGLGSALLALVFGFLSSVAFRR
jgi:uncharacterized protein (TIGR02186 family)